MRRYHKITYPIIWCVIYILFAGGPTLFCSPVLAETTLGSQNSDTTNNDQQEFPDVHLTASGGASQIVFTSHITWSQASIRTISSQEYVIESVRCATILNVSCSDLTASVTYNDRTGDITINGAQNPTDLTITVTYMPNIYDLSGFLDILNGITCHAVVTLDDGTLGLALVGMPADGGSNTAAAIAANNGILQPHFQGAGQVSPSIIEQITRLTGQPASSQAVRGLTITQNLKYIGIGTCSTGQAGIIVLGGYSIIDLTVYGATGGQRTIGPATALGNWIGTKIYNPDDHAVYITPAEWRKIRPSFVTADDAIKYAIEMAKRKRGTVCGALFTLYMEALLGDNRYISKGGTSDWHNMNVVTEAMYKLGCYHVRVNWTSKDVLLYQSTHDLHHEIYDGLHLAQAGYWVLFVWDTNPNGGASLGDVEIAGEGLADMKGTNSAGDWKNIVGIIRKSCEDGQSPFKIVDIVGCPNDSIRSAKEAEQMINKDKKMMEYIREGKLKKAWVVYTKKSGNIGVYKMKFIRN